MNVSLQLRTGEGRFVSKISKFHECLRLCHVHNCDLNLRFDLEPYDGWPETYRDVGELDRLNLRLFIHMIKSALAKYGNQITLVVFDFCQPDALRGALESLLALKSAPQLSAVAFPAWPRAYAIDNARPNDPSVANLARLCSRMSANKHTQASHVPLDPIITVFEANQFPIFKPTNPLPSPVHYFVDFLLVSLELNTNSVPWWDNRVQRVFPMLKRLTLTATAMFVRGFLAANALPSLTSATILFYPVYQSKNSVNLSPVLQVNPRFERLEELSISFPFNQAMLSVFALFVESPLNYLCIPSDPIQWGLVDGVNLEGILKVLPQFQSYPEYIELSFPNRRFSYNPHLILTHLNLHRTKRLKIVSALMISYPRSWECMILNCAPVLKELILDGIHGEHIIPYLSLEADKLERLEIINQHSNVRVPVWYTASRCISIFPSLRHIRYDHRTFHELIPYIMKRAPNLLTLLVNAEVHRDSKFFADSLKRWLAPKSDGTILVPYLKVLHIKVIGSRYSKETCSSAVESVNTLISARDEAGAGRYLNITISWEDAPEVQLRWEDGQLVLPSSTPAEDAQC
jgi:hypothetical protein